MSELDRTKLEKALEYIDSWLDFNFSASTYAGMQVGVSHKDEVLYSNSFGYANLETKTELNDDHIFRIASHSKTFTSTAIMMLVEQGKIRLDDQVSDHLKWFRSTEDERVEKISIRQLLNHTSGLIRDGLDSSFWSLNREFPKKDELIEYVSQAKLCYDPDEIFKYSNFGYGYLGLLIEHISGQGFAEYLDEKIIKPLEMENTYAEYFGDDLKLASGHSADFYRRPRKVVEHRTTNDLAAATSFCSTAKDLCKFYSAMMIGSGKLIADSSKRIIQHGYFEAQSDQSYGLGFVNYKKQGWDLYGHSGGFPGFITNTQFDSSREVVISVLTNSYDGLASTISMKLLSIIDYFQKNYSDTQNNFDKYQCSLFSNWSPIDFVSMGNKLIYLSPMNWTELDWAMDLEHISDNKFKICKGTIAPGFDSHGEEVEFLFDGDRVSKVHFAGRELVSFNQAIKNDWY